MARPEPHPPYPLAAGAGNLRRNAPSAGALLIERAGTDFTLIVLTGFAVLNVVLIAALWWLCRRG